MKCDENNDKPDFEIRGKCRFQASIIHISIKYFSFGQAGEFKGYQCKSNVGIHQSFICQRWIIQRLQNSTVLDVSHLLSVSTFYFYLSVDFRHYEKYI